MRVYARILAAAAVLAGTASTVAATNQCVVSARAEYLACKTDCRDDFVQARFTCRGVEPACGRACLAGRQVCLDNARAPLEACVGQCRGDLQTAKMSCPPPGDPARDACIDAAQLVAFVCRDGCREAWRSDPATEAALQNCRETFRACVAACPRL